MDTRAYFLDSNDESHSPEPTRAVYDRIRKMTHLNSNSEYVRVCVGNNKKEEVFRLPQQTLEEEEVEREKKESVEEKSERSDEEPKVTLWTNKQICDELMKLQKIYEDERDIGRKIAYLKAVSMIRSLDYDIDEKTDLGQIKGIGRKIADKIKELMQTGKINKLETFQLNEKMVVCGQLCQIWGVGGSKAN